MVAPLGSNVTLECVADQPLLVWSINNLQLLDPAIIQRFKDAGIIIEIGATESVPGGNRITITIPATVTVNATINSIICSAGSTEFDLQDGDIITFTVYSE